MASTKRELPFSDETQLKKSRVAELERFQSPAIANMRVLLNPADCDIDFNVGRDGLQGSALYEEGFAYCWSGARANIGVTRGKYCFGCKIVSAQPVVMEDTPVDQQHVCRVGISRGDDAVRNLGETVHSFGFGGTGKFSNSGNFFSYGETFGVGDTIVCCVDLEDRPMASIGFSKNGKWLGVAKYFDAGPSGLGVVGSPIKYLQWESALFPHVLLKNVAVQLQFSIDDGLIPEDGYKPWATAIFDGNTVLGPTFANENDCEVLMMVGLPASGKTTWAEKWVKEHPEKRYVLLGTNLALEQMKVPGLLRKHNYSERFDRLMDRATKIFNVLLSRASKIPRSFIIDQTNVYKRARKRKLKPFANYIKIAVVAFPTAEELKLRADKRFKEMGKEVPAEAVNQMLGYQSSYSSQPLSGAAYGSCYIGPSTYGSRLDFDNTGSLKGYDCSGISESQSRVLTSHGGSGEVYNSYRANDAYNHTGVGSQHFSHGVTVDPSLSNTVEPYSRALSYNTCDDRYTSGSGGTLHDVPAMRHSAYQPATQVPYGSYGTQIPKPPFGSFPNDAQHAGAGGGYHQPSALRPPPMNFPADAQRPGLYPRPPWGY
ncbi:UNVERIFIED_CONTAM: Heterogeneous nuclear ribonucleoprotein U-like protein 1 [Sesamum angustifolium]|uniref:Heterogeneous nuclear ribonucleoprotein U-like protein 1 n=1 Tax=Sesamum angustifolium TaxID=2727405 RepID=A0AAW2KVM3_9LAMI